MRVVIALGGNALLRRGEPAEADAQRRNVATAVAAIADVARDHEVIVTHGNGPQVGFILRRSEIATGEVPTVPVRYAVGDTQGAIGFMFQNALGNALRRRRIDKAVVALVTQTLVDHDDPAFAHPDKPIGSFMSEDTARHLARELGWSIMPDANRGWRRAIASPQPLAIVEAPIIERLARDGVLVVACGGGGIAVQRTAAGTLEGVEAVVDKDRASALLAIAMSADLLLIPTGVERVAIRFGRPDQQWLDRLGIEEAKRYAAEGHFGAGSMGPKIEALLAFVGARPAGREIGRASCRERV